MFAMATHVFSGFSGVLQVFQLFRTYVVSVSCCKSRSSIAHAVIGPTCHSRLLQLLGRRRADTDALAYMRVGSGGGTSYPRVRSGDVAPVLTRPQYRPMDRYPMDVRILAIPKKNMIES
jgi:hypothetical protein